MDNIEKLKEKVAKDPSSKLFVPLAEEYRKINMPDAAIEVLKDGIERQPGYMSARVSLGKIYLEKGMKAEAREEFETVIRAIPDNLYARRKLADLYRESKEFDHALEQYKTVLKLNPFDDEAHSHMIEIEAAIRSAGAGAAAPPAFGEVSLEEPAEAAPEEEFPEELAGAVAEEVPAETPLWGEPEAVEVFAVEEEGPPAEEAPAEAVSEELPSGLWFEGAGEEAAVEVSEFEEAAFPEEAEAETFEEPALEEAAIVETVEEAVLEEAVLAAEGDGIERADSFIENDDYAKAAGIYGSLLSSSPGDRRVLQRLEELKFLLRLTGREGDFTEAKLELFLEGIKRRKDEFLSHS